MNERHDFALFGNAERGGRLVHDDDARVPVDRAADGDGLALAARKRRDRRVEPFDVKVEFGHRRFGRLRHLLAVEHGQEAERPPHRLAAKEDVAADGEVVGQREVLIDRLDAAIARFVRRAERHGPPVEQDVALVVAEHARDRLDDRRFARAIVARQRDHFAGEHVERNAVERLYRAEPFGDVLDHEDGLRLTHQAGLRDSGAASGRRARRR